MSMTNTAGTKTRKTSSTRRNGKPVLTSLADLGTEAPIIDSTIEATAAPVGLPIPDQPERDTAPLPGTTAVVDHDDESSPEPALQPGEQPTSETKGAHQEQPTPREDLQPIAPVVTAADIARTEHETFAEIIERDKAIDATDLQRMIQDGQALQRNFDLQRQIVKKDRFAKRCAEVISRFDSAFSSARGGKKARPWDALRSYWFYQLVSDAAKEYINDEEDPFPVAMLTDLAKTFLKVDDTTGVYSIEFGLDDEASQLVVDAFANNWTVAVAVDKAKGIVTTRRDLDPASDEAKRNREKERVERKKELKSLFERMAKSLKEKKATPTEIMHYLLDAEVIETGAPEKMVDIDAVDPTKARALADAIIATDNATAAAILVERLKDFAKNAPVIAAPSRPAPKAGPSLNASGRASKNPMIAPTNRIPQRFRKIG